jgi:hypothetical protein
MGMLREWQANIPSQRLHPIKTFQNEHENKP